MSKDALGELIAYRLEQGCDALAESRLLQEAGHFRAAVNRAYYAMFYAVQALLAQGGLSTSKHSGAISLFDREFVKPGRFPKDLSKSLHEIFDLRLDADYGDMLRVSQRQAQSALREAEAFVSSVREFLSR